ncbi:hypothetical protein BN137_3655 [Cronobacter condimenti 1330]|uniref:DUF1330 domain-containing protein n=1 Tax=Cronobacter condimenti 1330 TaxID=1073999 RepID=K8AJ23_9ENTR|nr:DUF1330 domain-containing protein [Cronobacter condimenti]ALB64945.1 hypothetical protein AFK62_20625 [Cronobacter condimenti 1330]CCJ74257.1 hypothetical protein BN137_3655 [Cronobacter condimenti 1330]
MPKGYLIAHVTITDPDAYAGYAQAAGEALKGFNPNVVTWSGRHENVEGDAHEKHVVLEFASFEEAQRFYHSPAYEAARALREHAAHGSFYLVEGEA